MPPHMAPHAGGAIPARLAKADEPAGLFPDIPESKKRKFILVEDNIRSTRLRVRVTLEGVDTNEIPDSFRKGASLYPRSFFPREMQSPPPSATGSRFFDDDYEDDRIEETEGRDSSRRGAKQNSKEMIRAPAGSNREIEAGIPAMKKTARGREVRLNDIGYRMAWLQSRVFSQRPVFLQRASKCFEADYRGAVFWC